jgi:hypothetical protein
MPAMRRQLFLLVLGYVTLDFANPLMPGAVTFAAGSVEVVQADRTARMARPAAVPARLPAALPTWTATLWDATPTRTAPASTPAPVATGRSARRAPPPSDFAPPPPSEDH